MARKGKHRRPEQDWDEPARLSGRKRRRRHGEDREPAPAAVLAPPKPRPTTCYQCGHLVVTKSIVKLVNQSWDRAISYPTLTCFQQRWTLEDPESVEDPTVVSEYLVDHADDCPDFARGYPRDNRYGGW